MIRNHTKIGHNLNLQLNVILEYILYNLYSIDDVDNLISIFRNLFYFSIGSMYYLRFSIVLLCGGCLLSRPGIRSRCLLNRQAVRMLWGRRVGLLAFLGWNRILFGSWRTMDTWKIFDLHLAFINSYLLPNPNSLINTSRKQSIWLPWISQSKYSSSMPSQSLHNRLGLNLSIPYFDSPISRTSNNKDLIEYFLSKQTFNLSFMNIG